jgi:hypothetical protein
METEALSRLAMIEAREQIRELPARYAWASARADVSAMVALFVEDCEFETGRSGARNCIKGREALRAHLSRSLDRPGKIIALIHNQTIEIAGDEATGTCVMSNPIAPPENSPAVGYYRDAFRRVNDKWLYAARRFWTYSPVLDLASD